MLPWTDDKGRNLTVNMRWLIPYADVALATAPLEEEAPAEGLAEFSRRLMPMVAQPFATAISQRTAFGRKVLTGAENRSDALKKLAYASSVGTLPVLLGQYWAGLHRNATAGEEAKRPVAEKALVGPVVGGIRHFYPESQVSLRKARMGGLVRELQEEAGAMRGRLLRGSVTADTFREEVGKLWARSADPDISHPETLAVVRAVEDNRPDEARTAFLRLLRGGFYADEDEAKDKIEAVLGLRERLRDLQASRLPDARAAGAGLLAELRQTGRVSGAQEQHLREVLSTLSDSDRDAVLKWLAEQIPIARRVHGTKRAKPMPRPMLGPPATFILPQPQPEP